MGAENPFSPRVILFLGESFPPLFFGKGPQGVNDLLFGNCWAFLRVTREIKVTFFHPSPNLHLDIPNHSIRKLAAFNLRRTLHQPCKIISNVLAGDGRIHGVDDGIGGFSPAHIAQHHFTG